MAIVQQDGALNAIARLRSAANDTVRSELLELVATLSLASDAKRLLEQAHII